MYAGLRRGELLALRWKDVDFDRGVIHVERSYDPKAGVYVAPKSRAGRRTAPIASALRGLLIEHRLATGRGEGLVFGTSAGHPFTPSNASRRASTAWRAANKARQEAELEPLRPISLDECRHTFASLMIAAGVNNGTRPAMDLRLRRYGCGANMSWRPLREARHAQGDG
jgi:integrase